MDKFKVLIVDDHRLVSNSLKKLIDSFSDFEVIQQLSNGIELIAFLESSQTKIDLILLDVHMPKMDGMEVMTWIAKNRPELKVLVLSMEEDERTIIHMLKNGANGYILKDVDPLDFKTALNAVISKGCYYTPQVNELLIKQLNKKEEEKLQFNDRELNFLQLVCSEKTYKEIASDMFLSPKTIDGYRENLFKKLAVKNRIGLVIYAIKNGIYQV